MEYKAVRNPQWANVEETLINCEVDFACTDGGFLPFSAAAVGDYPHTHEIFSRATSGEFGEIAAFQPPPPPSTEEMSVAVREDRNRRIAETDWTQAMDIPEGTKLLWVPFRQALRDIPSQEGFPLNIEWPTAPD